MTDQNRQSMLLSKIAAYTEILVKDPRSTIFVSLAETYRKLGLLDDARRIIEKGLDQHPDFSPAHIVLARVLCQLANYSGSQQAFETALELDPESLAAFVGYARVKILLGEEAAARELLLRARQLSPADPVINKLLLALPQETDEKVDEETSAETLDVATPESEDTEEESAEPVTEAATAATPLVSSTLAELYLRQGLKEQALNVYRELLQRKPDDLSLRRVIKELEGESVDGEESDSAETSAPAQEPEDEVRTETAEQEPELEAAAAAVESQLNDTEQDKPADEQILTTLNQWLHNIQQRRGNV